MQPAILCRRGHQKRKSKKGVAYCPTCSSEATSRWLERNPIQRKIRSLRASKWNADRKNPQNAVPSALRLMEGWKGDFSEEGLSPLPSDSFPESFEPDLLEMVVEEVFGDEVLG